LKAALSKNVAIAMHFNMTVLLHFNYDSDTKVDVGQDSRSWLITLSLLIHHVTL